MRHAWGTEKFFGGKPRGSGRRGEGRPSAAITTITGGKKGGKGTLRPSSQTQGVSLPTGLKTGKGKRTPESKRTKRTPPGYRQEDLRSLEGKQKKFFVKEAHG